MPGTVAGLYKAHQELGSLPWAELVGPAVKMAREGIPITYSLQTGFKEARTDLGSIRPPQKNSSKVMVHFMSWEMYGFNLTSLTRLNLFREMARTQYKGENAKKVCRFYGK